VSIILPILPEVLLLSIGILALIVDPFLKKDANRRSFLGWFTTVGLLLTLAVSALFARPAEAVLVFGGMLRFDWLGFLFEMFFIFAAAITALFFMDMDILNRRAEGYLLLLAATLY